MTNITNTVWVVLWREHYEPSSLIGVTHDVLSARTLAETDAKRPIQWEPWLTGWRALPFEPPFCGYYEIIEQEVRS